MPIDSGAFDASAFRILNPLEMPSELDAAQKAMTLSQLGLQKKKMQQEMGAAERDGNYKAYRQKMSVLGNTLEGMAGMSEEARAAAYPKLRENLIGQGVLTPQDAPEEYDPGLYRQTLMGWRQTPEYLDQKKTQAEIAKLRADSVSPKRSLSPGEEAADKAFAQDAADYYYGGGKSGVEKNFQRLEGAISKLQSNPKLTGGVSTKLPLLGSDEAQDVINPELASVRDDIRGAIQSTLKQILGGQFTEKEAQAMFNRAFNPRLSAEENIKRATAELNQIRRMAAEKDRSMEHFMAAGTLKGYKPRATALEGNEDPQNAKRESGSGFVNNAYAAPPIKPGTEDGGYIYLGGDPSNPKNWKRAK